MEGLIGALSAYLGVLVAALATASVAAVAIGAALSAEKRREK